MIRQYDSIIFDLDGTLWDPTDMCLASWNEILETFDYVKEPMTKEALQRIFGMKVDLIGGVLFPTLTEEQQHEVMSACIDYENEYIQKHGALLYEE